MFARTFCLLADSIVAFTKDRKVFPSKIVCVARNYSKLESELKAPLSQRMHQASIFMKPASSLASIHDSIDLHNYEDVVCETELALLLSKGLPKSHQGYSDETIMNVIGGIGLAFDLTRKEMQNALKAQGKPWELAKGFDGACPLSGFVPMTQSNFDIRLTVNGEEILNQSTSDMILSPFDLIRLVNQHMSLWPGDIILTGTPTYPKVPPVLKSGDSITASLGSVLTVSTRVY